MRAYADSSFIVRLVTSEPDSPQVVALYRRLRLPKLFFLPLHALKVRNAILQRAFHQRRTTSSRERRQIVRERDTALLATFCNSLFIRHYLMWLIPWIVLLVGVIVS